MTEAGNNTINNDSEPEKTVLIPVLEEQIRVAKATVETGSIKIAKHITESPEIINVSLSHDEHFITHVPINIFVDELPSIRYEGDVMVIPVLKEVLVKRTMLVEEIRVNKQVIHTNEEHNVMLRKENVTIERVQSTIISK